jgi:hypothetical protein
MDVGFFGDLLPFPFVLLPVLNLATFPGFLLSAENSSNQ